MVRQREQVDDEDEDEEDADDGEAKDADADGARGLDRRAACQPTPLATRAGRLR